MSDLNGNFLAKYGKSLIENGYSIIPIPVGSKSPGYDGWQKTRSTQGALRDWLSDGHKDSGIGILTKNTPAIDLDILDADVAQQIEDWCIENIGNAPVRVGRAPRRLLVFRTDEPFRKMKTGKYRDEWNDEHEIEILGDGQQFVAYANHKDTGLPYTWTSETEPTNLIGDDLPLLTPDLAKKLLAYFVEIAEELGWEKITNGLSGGARHPDAEDDPFADIETVVDLPADELRKRLLMIPGNEDYELWVQIGMALFHQFDGDDEGLHLWHEWSETADNYAQEELDKKWHSFQIDGKGRAPITARLIIKLANEAMTTLSAAKVVELRDQFFAAKEISDWHAVCKEVRKAEIDSIARAEIIEIARKKYQDISGVKLPLPEVRKALSYQMTVQDNSPRWCNDWVYDAADDKFFHLASKISMSKQGFDMVYSRQALTKQDIIEGKSSPSASASDLALNVYKIATIYGRLYAPGKETIFTQHGLHVGNTYPEYQVPEVPKDLRSMDKANIRRVKEHIAHILADEREQKLLLNWLAWIVQNPGKRLNWAVVLQGVEGDGKSFFGVLLAAVMGDSNVRMMNAHVLEGNFTGWAHGQCVAVIEEPRLHGHNKYDIINRIKPFITNQTIEIHPKGRDPYNVENTTNYYLPTNYRDALPLNDNDRRYCVFFSRWQSAASLREFVFDNTDYYLNLYNAVRDSAPALRKWLIGIEIDSEFPAGGNAPETKAHKYMVQASTPETIRALDEVIEEGLHPDITKDLVNLTALADALIGRDADLPSTSTLAKLMENNGYTYLGRSKVDDRSCRFWSRNPTMFKDGDILNTRMIQKYIKMQKENLEL